MSSHDLHDYIIQDHSTDSSNSGGIGEVLTPFRPNSEEALIEWYNFTHKFVNKENALEITITFKDSTLRIYKDEYMFTQIMKYLKKKPYLKCGLVADYSKTGRFHLHGIIEFQDITKVKTIKNYFSRTYGQIHINRISFYDSYVKYCIGQYDKDHEKYMDNLHLNNDCIRYKL